MPNAWNNRAMPARRRAAFHSAPAALLHLVILLGATTTPIPARANSNVWNFTDITTQAGFNYVHGYTGGLVDDAHYFSGGVAAGDYDKDGDIDLYVVHGDIGANLLFRNRGNGTFQEVAASAGVNITGVKSSAPIFADYDGDGWLDLLIGGIGAAEPRLYRNLGNGTFQNVTATCGIVYTNDTYSSAFGDYDRDGDLDILMCHWGAPQYSWGHLWRNNGNGTFTNVDQAAGFNLFGDDIIEFTLTGNFADVNNDRWPDILFASDYGSSEIYLNDGDGTFTEVTDELVVTDQFGMGGSVADYDDDGDLDWFVSSIYDPPSLRDGNRLYRNTGAGVFEDVTSAAGVRVGGWGWGSSFADYNNDGNVDLYHVNGMRVPFAADTSRMFVANGAGAFTEMSAPLGVNDTRSGRGVVSFDFDRDGDLDIFVANNSQGPTFYRNNGGNAMNWLGVKLVGLAPNTEAIGARIYVTANGKTQMRELRAGTNYVSQDPAEAHFGLGAATVTGLVRVEWPNGEEYLISGIPANHFIVLNQAEGITSVSGGSAVDGAGAGGALSLDGSAPNPFVDRAVIRFSLGAAAHVRLGVYDLSGRRVRALLDGAGAAGTHEVAWDRRDDAGRAVAPGIYAYRIDALGMSAHGKMTVVR